MSYKHLVVNMGHPNAQNRADLAARLARAHGAYLLGRYYAVQRRTATPGAANVAPGQLGTGTAAAPAAATPAQDPEQSREMRRAQELFDQAVRDQGVQGDFDAMAAGSRPLWECLLEEARCTDVTIVGKPGDGAGEKELVKNMVAESGGPVMVVPNSAQDTPGQAHVVVAWNGTPEAARAVRSAVPLIETAQRVTVLMVKPKADTLASSGRLETFLTKHGASVEVNSETSNIRPSESLISRAEQVGADVVVMGAFGRARLREVITGGATTARTIESATVPLLLAQ